MDCGCSGLLALTFFLFLCLALLLGSWAWTWASPPLPWAREGSLPCRPAVRGPLGVDGGVLSGESVSLFPEWTCGNKIKNVAA